MRINGTYEEYEKNMVASNAENYLDDLESYLLEAINESNTSYVSERGEVERWKGGVDKEKFTSKMKEDFKGFRKKIKEYRDD